MLKHKLTPVMVVEIRFLPAKHTPWF